MIIKTILLINNTRVIDRRTRYELRFTISVFVIISVGFPAEFRKSRRHNARLTRIITSEKNTGRSPVGNAFYRVIFSGHIELFSIRRLEQTILKTAYAKLKTFKRNSTNTSLCVIDTVTCQSLRLLLRLAFLFSMRIELDQSELK